jgi:GNAT superfamily N-acetyltransferase
LVKLYELPDAGSNRNTPLPHGVHVREAMAYEKQAVVEWVRAQFGPAWGSECDVAFSNRPISCHIATQSGAILGFACYDSTCRGFFGPIGLIQAMRGHGIGRALLFSCLHAMAAAGYAYAVVGGVQDTEYYARAVGAIEIPGSAPGIYRDRLKTPAP